MTEDFPYAGWPSTFVELPAEVTLHVRNGPSLPGAEPAVLVHGLGGSSTNWTALVGLLADRLESKAPDLPGFGMSPPPHDGDYSIGAQARAVIAFIEQDGRGAVHLFGNSLGGAIATSVAAARPDLVRTLTLISPALPDLVPGRWRSQVVTLAVPGVGATIARRLSTMSPEERVDGVVRLCFADPTTVPAAWRSAAIDDARVRQRLPYAPDAMVRSTQGIARAFLARGNDALWAQAARVSVPTMIIYGRQDRLVRPESATRARRAFRGARVVVMPHTGHVAQMEHPHLVARMVRDRLDEVAPVDR